MRTWALLLIAGASALAQPGVFGKAELVQYTPDWKGERFADGRPKVPDGILKRMKNVTLEEAWAVLRNAGFTHQYEDGWVSIHPEKVLVGRALTATWMPGRPDIHKVIAEQGKKDNRIGGQNAWPVDMLQPGDVYVCDHFGLKEDGPSIGDNVGNSIYAKSGNGIVYDGAVRDIVGLNELENFTSFMRSYHPSHHFSTLGDRLNSTMISINAPTRIGKALAMPGDVVLGRDGGVLFIPPQNGRESGEDVGDRAAAGSVRAISGCARASTPPGRSTHAGRMRLRRISRDGCGSTKISCRCRRSRFRRF